MKNRVLSLIPVGIIFVISILAILPLFHSGFFSMHDNTQVQRVFEMQKSLRDGMFPVRWVDDLGYGYGYPLFNFYGPLAYYVGAFFAFFSDSLTATKIMIGLAVIGSGASMYLLAKSLWGKWAGVASAMLYVFAPYHAVDLYVRGDVGELWAYMFVPVAVLGFYKLFMSLDSSKNPNQKIFNSQFSVFNWIIVASVGFGGVILSHNLSAFMVTPFLLLFVLMLLIRSKHTLLATYYILLSIVIALAMTSFYWLPVFAEMKYTNVLSQVGGTADFHSHFVCLPQLWQSQWGFGGSTSGCVDGLSFMMGKIQIILSVVGLILLPFLWKRREQFFLGIYCIVGLSVSVFMMLSFSTPLWNAISQMAFLQYPWRYLLLASFFSSLLGGMVINVIYQRQKTVGLGMLLVVGVAIIVLNFKYFQPQEYLSLTSSSLTAKEFLNWTTSKISDEYLPSSFQKPKGIEALPKGLVVSSPMRSIQKEVLKTAKKEVFFSLQKDQLVPLHLAYFPGWQAIVDGKTVLLQKTPNGTSVYLPEGTHTLSLAYSGTFVEQVSNLVSLTSAIILILGIIWSVTAYERKSA